MTLHGQPINVGDRVWDFLDGWTEVTYIVDNSLYAIHTTRRSYTSDGKFQNGYLATTLFWNEFEVPKIAFKPLSNLAVDTKVLVWNNGATVKERRYFSYFDNNGTICCFVDGANSWANVTTISWSHWELYEEES
jgi:hypothetical protein